MTLDDILAKVTTLTTADDSLIALVQQLAELLRQSASDPAKVQAIADQLDAEATKVAAAVQANTPGA